MTRSRLYFVYLLCAGIATLLGSCEWIADIPERARITEPCDRYCELAAQLCTDEYAIFHTATDCANICATYNDDALKCREKALEQVQLSRSNDAATYCARASLSGGGGEDKDKCGGSACKNYCKAMGQVCQAKYPESGVTYPDANGSKSEECERQCEVIPDREKMGGRSASASTFDLSLDHEGDTIQCRLVHLTLASTDADLAEEHCPHAYINPQPMGPDDAKAAPYCSTLIHETEPRCEDYCSIIMAACVDTDDAKLQVYENYNECMGACGIMNKGDLSDYMGADPNTVACRKYHAYNAVVLGNPTAHCSHAGPGGASICGDDCDSLCRLIEMGCSDQWQSEFMGSEKTCRDECKASDAYKKRGNYSIAAAKRGDPFACRLYHAAQSESQREDNKDACDIASGLRSCPFPN